MRTVVVSEERKVTVTVRREVLEIDHESIEPAQGVAEHGSVPAVETVLQI